MEILRHGIVAFGVKTLSALSAFAMTVIISRQLGASEAGLFFLGVSIVSVVSALSRLGLENTLVRFIAGHRAAGEAGAIAAVISTALGWSMAASAILAVPIALLAEPIAGGVFGKPEFAPVLRILAAGIPLMAFYTLYAYALQGLKQVTQSLTVLNVALPLTVVVLALLLHPVAAMDGARLYVVAAALSLILGLLWWRTYSRTDAALIPVDRRALLASCLPLYVAVVLNQVVTWSSQLILGASANAEDVAVFNAALRTAMLTSFVLIAVNSIAAPKFAELHRLGQTDALRRTAVVTTRMMALMGGVPLAVMLVAPEQLMSIFGPEYERGANALRILAAGQFVNVGTGSVGLLLAMTGNERALRNNMVLAALVCVGLGSILIPFAGLIGAAISTAIGVSTLNLLGLWQTKRLLGFSTIG